MTERPRDFLAGTDATPRTWRDTAREERGRYWTGRGRDGLEVAHIGFDATPSVAEVRKLWAERHKRRAAPLLVVAEYAGTAWLCGPVGEDPPVVERDLTQAERIAATALAEPSRHLAIQFLSEALQAPNDEVPGLRNRGLLATHELHRGVPGRSDWPKATARGMPLLQHQGAALVEALGFDVEQRRTHAVLRVGGAGHARAVAVFLDETEQPDRPSERFDRQSPVTFALNEADRDGLPYVLAVRGSTLRLYSTATSGAVGQRGRTETYVGIDLPLLPSDMAGYLSLLFSAEALAAGGTLEEIAAASQRYAADLSTRLRERIYTQVVPTLATAIASHVGASVETKADLDGHFHTAVTVLFRLLFVAYAEDSQLLPLGRNEHYTRHALKTTARELADTINEGRDLGFTNPLISAPTKATDTASTDLWDGCKALFTAIDHGRDGWGVPAYNGGLFSTDDDANQAGSTIASLDLTNAEFGPALVAMLTDRTADGVVGPIDFRSLSVREFGTIYEGLLESELARAEQDLTVNRDGVYIPADDRDQAVVAAGEVYLHNRSGARKSTGSYFTKPFAVEHLIATSVLPTLDEHLDRVAALIDDGDEVEAAELLFDFRVADISMGSGHFLTAVVDAIEARLQAFLTEHSLPQIANTLHRLRQAAMNNLGDLADTVEIEDTALLRRTIARRCVYGVDINHMAVELARVAMWIHTFVPGLPLSFLDHNLRAGDSLTGIGTIDEALEQVTGTGTAGGLFDYAVREAFKAAKEPLQRLANLNDISAHDIAAARDAADDISSAVAPVADFFNLTVAHRLGMLEQPLIASLDDLAEPDVALARELIETLDALHFPTAFPEVFNRERPGFDVLVGNPPWVEPVVEELDFWRRYRPGIKALSQVRQKEVIEHARRQRGDLVLEYERQREASERLRAALHAGPFPGMGVGDPDLYKAFAWRFLGLARKGGAIGVVLPRSAFQASGSASWRKALLPLSDVSIVNIGNRDGWAFTDVNPGYPISLLSCRNLQAGSGSLSIRGRYVGLDEFRTGIKAPGAHLKIEELANRDDGLSLPALESDAQLSVFAKLTASPPLGGTRADFTAVASREFDATNDRKKTGILRTDGDTPVYNHLNVGHFRFEADKGEFTRTDWHTAITELARRKRSNARRKNSPYHRMLTDRGSEWLEADETTPALQPRIAFRDVVHATNPRKVWAALLPANTLVTNKAPFLMFARGNEVSELYLLGMLGTSVCDWWGHLFVNLNLNYFLLYGLPIPLLRVGDDRCRRIVELAATLAVREEGDYGRYARYAETCVEDEGTRAELTAELDGIASLLYGLCDDELPLIWNESEPLRPALANVRRYRREWDSA